MSRASTVDCIYGLLKGIETKDWMNDPELRGARYGYMEALYSLGEKVIQSADLQYFKWKAPAFEDLEYKIKFTEAELAAYKEALRLREDIK